MNRFSKSAAPSVARRGFTITEILVALVIMSAALAGIAHLVSTASAQRRVLEQRRLALAELSNRAERIALLSWDELTAAGIESEPLSSELLAVLPRAKFAAEITDENGPPSLRRIRLQIGWADRVGNAVEPVKLVVWRHREEAQP